MKEEIAPRGPKTPKAFATRQKIYDAALKLFGEKGYDETTLRDIAAEAGVSLGLAYRYFARKEEIVLLLYEDLVGHLGAKMALLPTGTTSLRFGALIRLTFGLLRPHRRTLGGLFGVGLSADSELAVFGPRASGVRERMWGLYNRVVTGASDALKPAQTDQLTTILYAGHLIFVLFWLLDRSPEQASTEALLKLTARMLQTLRPVMGLKLVSEPLSDIHGILAPMFAPTKSGVV